MKSYVYFKALSRVFFNQIYGLLHQTLTEILQKAIGKGDFTQADQAGSHVMVCSSAREVFAWLFSSYESFPSTYIVTSWNTEVFF